MNTENQIIQITHLIEQNLGIATFGNCSIRDNISIKIKPSGVLSQDLTSESISEVSLSTGKHVSGLKPSSDLDTHLVLYREYPEINAIIHTHSEYATSWAQSGLPIPCLGTTHADYWISDIPITDSLSPDDIENDYVQNTGLAIVRTLRDLNLDPKNTPGILVKHHGPFVWGETIEKAYEHAIILEYIAKLALHTTSINPKIQSIPKELHKQHYLRKHGPNATYGQ